MKNKFFFNLLILILLICTKALSFSPKCIKGNCENGKGIIDYDGLFTEEGKFENGELNGYGIKTNYFFGEKKIRKGNFKNGMPEGIITDIYNNDIISKRKIENGKLVVNYTGCVEGNCKNGKGIYFFPNGDEYHGEFKNGKMHGQGTLIYGYSYQRNSWHIGKFENNKINGEGILYTLKFKYSSNWLDGKLNGYTTIVEQHKNGVETTKGNFKNDNKHGKIEITSPNGATVISQWNNGKLVDSKYASEKDKELVQMSFTIGEKKQQCKTIGFKPETEKFADCVLRLVELDVKKQTQNQIVIAENNGNLELANQLKRQNNLQASEALINLGQQLMNPKQYNSNIYMPQTRRCRISGYGNFARVTCY